MLYRVYRTGARYHDGRDTPPRHSLRQYTWCVLPIVVTTVTASALTCLRSDQMLDKEWIIANVHLCYEYKRCLSEGDVFGLSGDLYNLLEIVKAPLSPTSATPPGAQRAGRIVQFSPRRWWDAEGGAEAYPDASYIALRSTRRGEPIEVVWSLPATPWLVFKLRWEAITGLALPEDLREDDGLQLVVEPRVRLEEVLDGLVPLHTDGRQLKEVAAQHELDAGKGLLPRVVGDG